MAEPANKPDAGHPAKNNLRIQAFELSGGPKYFTPPIHRALCVRQTRKLNGSRTISSKPSSNWEPGQCAAVPYEIFEVLFPPGAEDDSSKVAAYTFAKAHGCVIDHQPHKREVLFVKEAT